jgi:hypothetical protein
VRTPSITPLQALFMMNSELVHDCSTHLAARLLDGLPDDTERLNLAFERAFARPPSPAESARALDYLRQSREKLETSGVDSGRLNQEAWASMLRAMLASNEFVYVD